VAFCRPDAAVVAHGLLDADRGATQDDFVLQSARRRGLQKQLALCGELVNLMVDADRSGDDLVLAMKEWFESDPLRSDARRRKLEILEQVDAFKPQPVETA
jgi:hypothetical protein